MEATTVSTTAPDDAPSKVARTENFQSNAIKSDSEKQLFESDLLLGVLKQHYGYDFTHYSKDSLMRRLLEMQNGYGLKHVSDMIPLLLWDKGFFNTLLAKLTVGVTEMFRDPDFFISFRDKVLPSLTTFPYIKMWHAGCSSGEEVYSMAVLLQQHQLLARSIIYGTDINNDALEKAKSGIYPMENLQCSEQRFDQVKQPKSKLADYYHTSYQRGRIDESIISPITFSHHNLVQDGVFGEMNVICCRNTLIYFDEELQNHALSLFNKSLRYGGYLCLGKGESLCFTVLQDGFEAVDLKQRIYRKKLPNEMVTT